MIKPNLSLSPPILAFLLQAAAVLAVLFCNWAFGIKPSLIGFAASCGMLAAALSYWAKLPRWWLLIQGAFAPGLVLALSLNLDPRVFLTAFLVTALIFWNTLAARVPLYLSSKAVWQALERLLPTVESKNRIKFIDIGSGLGGVIIYLATVRPDIAYTGIESAPLPFLWGWLSSRLGGYRHCEMRWGDFWDCDLSQYDVVYAYLSPAPMAKLWKKANAEMKPGSLFISSTFTVPGQTPNETMQVDDLHNSTLLIWRM